jgi:hypothetical protein
MKTAAATAVTHSKRHPPGIANSVSTPSVPTEANPLAEAA